MGTFKVELIINSAGYDFSEEDIERIVYENVHFPAHSVVKIKAQKIEEDPGETSVKDHIEHIPGWEQLQKEFAKYLDVVTKDHHKTKDGFLYLTRYWDGWAEKDSGWELSHSGYCNEFRVTGDTLEEAIEEGIEKIKQITKEETEWKKEQGLIG